MRTVDRDDVLDLVSCLHFTVTHAKLSGAFTADLVARIANPHRLKSMLTRWSGCVVQPWWRDLLRVALHHALRNTARDAASLVALRASIDGEAAWLTDY